MLDNRGVPNRRNTKNSQSGPLLSAKALSVARHALEELGEGGVGAHIGVRNVSETSATHRFVADVPGYNGWEWNVVVACASGSCWVTVSELALVPGQEALQAPDWVPYHQRVQPGDLGPNDFMPPRPDDPRLTEDPEQAAYDFGTPKKLTKTGIQTASARWKGGAFGPSSEYAKKAVHNCGGCAFYFPLAEPVGNDFGVCVNEYSADGRVVHTTYGCGAHTDTPPAEPLGVAENSPFDDEKPEIFPAGTNQ